MNLVNRILLDAKIEEFVDQCATVIAENAPLTIGSLKQIFIELAKNPVERDPECCNEAIERCFTSEDYIEGRKAFLEKRKPSYPDKVSTDTPPNFPWWDEESFN